MDKIRYEAFTSPSGEAVFPWLNMPDTKHDANGVFHTDLSVAPEEAQDFIAKLERIRDEYMASLPMNQQQALHKRPVYMEEYTRPDYPEGATAEEKAAIRAGFEGEPTGNVLFRFKMKNKVHTKDGKVFEQVPIVVDAATGEKVEGTVFGGSIIRVRGQVVPYSNAAGGTVGVSLRLKAVQVIDLVSGSGGGDAAFWTDFDNNG